MTLEQLQSMSDAELNSLAAVKVMGYKLWHETPGGYHPFQGNYEWLENGANYPHFINYPNGRVILWEIPNADGRDWKPTTDMNDCFKIVKLIPRKYRIEIVRVEETGLFVCSIFEDDIKLLYSVESDMPARAITIAAILAKGSV